MKEQPAKIEESIELFSRHVVLDKELVEEWEDRDENVKYGSRSIELFSHKAVLGIIKRVACKTTSFWNLRTEPINKEQR